MRPNLRLLAIATLGVLLSVGSALAQNQNRDADQSRVRSELRDPEIYGYQMMTLQERNEYRARMRAAKTAEEREQIRAEHHAQMQARAKERGFTLSDQPPAGRGPTGAGGADRGGGYGPGRR